MASIATLLRPRKEEVETPAALTVAESPMRTRTLDPRISKTIRSSIPDGEDTVFAAISNIQSPERLPFDMPWEILEYMEVLASWDPDFSSAVDNVRNLAGRDFTIHPFGGNARNVEVVTKRIYKKFRTIGPHHGGAITSIVDNLVVQAATYGAMAGEWVIADDLKDVVDFVLINPKSIRFFWIDEEGRYAPFQKVSITAASAAQKRGQEVRGSCIRLNEASFVYAPYHNSVGGPYGIPPFIAAMSNIGVQNNMMKNLKQVVRKLGMLGVFDMTIKSLEMHPGESDANYQSRVEHYLQSYVPIAEQLVSDGSLIHYDDLDLNLTSLQGNSAGAATLHRTNREMIITGLKNFPMVQSERASSTIDTLAGLAFDLMLRSAKKYQYGVASILRQGFLLMDALWRTNALTDLAVIFEKNRPINRLYDALAYGAEIKNYNTLWVNGLIDQEEAAMGLGIEHPPVVPLAEPLVITAGYDEPEVYDKVVGEGAYEQHDPYLKSITPLEEEPETKPIIED